MNGASIVVRANFDREPAGRGEAANFNPRGRIPRVASMLALAHHVERKIRDGEFRDYAHAAEVLGMTRARISQISSLTLLTPSIQEAILDLPLVTNGRDTVTERQLRLLVAEPYWQKQLAMWRQIHE